MSIAKLALPNVSLENIDDILKDQFIYGIINDILREKVTMKLNKINDKAKEKITMTELVRYAQVAEISFIEKTAYIMLRRNYSSDDSGNDQPKQLLYVPEPQSLNICSILQSKESVQVKDPTGKSSVRHDNSDQIHKSIITQSKIVDAKTTQTEVVNDGPVTAENILQKRAEIRDFYVKQRGTDQQQSVNQARPQTNRYQNQQNIRRKQQICQFCVKKGHEMKV